MRHKRRTPLMLATGLGHIASAARLARDLPGFLRARPTPDEARVTMRRRLADRESAFLTLIERVVHRHPTSPYRLLLQAAGCEPGDLEALVRHEGLEGALTRLAAAGVFVSFDELKGRRPAVRGSQRFHFTDRDFENPLLQRHFETASGGTRGPASSITLDLGFLADRAPELMTVLDAHGVLDHDYVVWTHGAFGGIVPMLECAIARRPPVAWFYPVGPLDPRGRAATWYLAALAGLRGHRLPVPRFQDLRRPERLAATLASRLAQGRAVCLATYPSLAVRLAHAAREHGHVLDGLHVMARGEPLTPGRRRALEAAGIRVFGHFGFSEGGALAYGCATPTHADDLHLLRDGYAVIQRSRPIEGTDVEVDAFLFTALHQRTPKILLNVESGDHGRLERGRRCGCALGALGLTDHIFEIRSFEKLTAEAMTFVGVDLLRVLDEVLPGRFGGSGADYQLVETEDDEDQPELLLLVSPRLGDVDSASVREAFLTGLGETGAADKHRTAFWRRTGMVKVRREWPARTRYGKTLPFHVVPRA